MRAAGAPDLTLRAIFDAPTIAALAAGLAPLSAPRSITPTPQSDAGFAPLSFAQERLWFLDQLQGSSSEYHIADAWLLSGALDLVALARALNHLLTRHSSLRTHVELRGDHPLQVVTPAQDMALALTDLSVMTPDARQHAVQQALAREWEQPFDLTRGPLLRVSLIRSAPDQHLLLRTCHHLVADGWSMNLFDIELFTLYVAAQAEQPLERALAPLPLQYLDFSRRQRARQNLERQAEGLAYWQAQLAGIPSPANAGERSPTSGDTGVSRALGAPPSVRD